MRSLSGWATTPWAWTPTPRRCAGPPTPPLPTLRDLDRRSPRPGPSLGVRRARRRPGVPAPARAGPQRRGADLWGVRKLGRLAPSSGRPFSGRLPPSLAALNLTRDPWSGEHMRLGRWEGRVPCSRIDVALNFSSSKATGRATGQTGLRHARHWRVSAVVVEPEAAGLKSNTRSNKLTATRANHSRLGGRIAPSRVLKCSGPHQVDAPERSSNDEVAGSNPVGGATSTGRRVGQSSSAPLPLPSFLGLPSPFSLPWPPFSAFAVVSSAGSDRSSLASSASA